MTVSCIGLGPNFPTSSGLGWIGSVKVGLDRVTQSGPMDNAALTCIMAVKRWQWRYLLLLLLLFHFYKAPDISVPWRGLKSGGVCERCAANRGGYSATAALPHQRMMTNDVAKQRQQQQLQQYAYTQHMNRTDRRTDQGPVAVSRWGRGGGGTGPSKSWLAHSQI